MVVIDGGWGEEEFPIVSFIPRIQRPQKISKLLFICKVVGTYYNSVVFRNLCDNIVVARNNIGIYYEYNERKLYVISGGNARTTIFS